MAQFVKFNTRSFFKKNVTQKIAIACVALILLAIPFVVVLQTRHQQDKTHADVVGNGQNYQICSNPTQFLTSPWTYHALSSGSQTYTVAQYEALPGYGTSLPPLPSYIANEGATTTAAVIFAPGSTVSVPPYDYPNSPVLYFFEGGSYGPIDFQAVSGNQYIGGSAPGYPEPQFNDNNGVGGISGQNDSYDYPNSTTAISHLASAAAQGATSIILTNSTIPLVQWGAVNIGGHSYTMDAVSGSQSGYTITISGGLDTAQAANAPVYYSGVAGGVTVSYLDISHDLHDTTGTIYTGSGWTISHNNIHDSYSDTDHGAGVAIYGGDEGIIEYNCLSKMGDYGVNLFGKNNKFRMNEITQSNYEVDNSGNGQAGSGKWWGTLNADITDNAFINNSPGNSLVIWLDNGNSGTNISGNYFDKSSSSAIHSETGFNLSVTNNLFQNGGWGTGNGCGDSNCVGSVNINSSGGFHVPNSRYDNQIIVSGNQFINDWGGVSIWQSGGRSCENSGEGWPYDAPYCSGGFPNTRNTDVGGQYYFSHYSDSSNEQDNVTVSVAASAGSNTIQVGSSQAINDQIGFSDPAKTTTTSTTDVKTLNGSQTITAASTANFPSTGQLRVGTSQAWGDGNGSWTGAILTYSGKTSTSFTGVSLVRGAGTLSGPVWQVQPYKVTSETCYTNDCVVSISPALTTSVSAGATVTNAGTCQLFATAGTSPTSPLAPDGTSYFDGCQWGTKNISVIDNTFSFDPAAIAAGTTVTGHVGTSCTAGHADSCGTNFMAFQEAGEPPFETFINGNSMLSNSNLTTCPSWDPGCTNNPLKNINALSNPPSAPANNNEPSNNIVWSNNAYYGPWLWNTYWYGNCNVVPSDPATGHSMPSGACNVDFSHWQSDWQQDAGSSFSSTPFSGQIGGQISSGAPSDNATPTPPPVTQQPSPTTIPNVPTPTPTLKPTAIPTVRPTTIPPTVTPLPLYSSAGFTTWNGQLDSQNVNMISSTQVITGASGGTLQSITVYIAKAGGAPYNHVQVAIYSDNGSNNPGTLLKTSTTQVIKANAWNTISLSGVTITPNTKYFLAFNVDSSKTQYGWNSKSKGISRWKSKIKFGTWPSTFGTPSYAYNQQYAIFMTYK